MTFYDELTQLEHELNHALHPTINAHTAATGKPEAAKRLDVAAWGSRPFFGITATTGGYTSSLP